METKHWWASRTLIVNIIAIIAIVLNSQVGIELDAEMQAIFATSILALINIILRIKTNTALTK